MRCNEQKLRIGSAIGGHRRAKIGAGGRDFLEHVGFESGLETFNAVC